METDPLYARCGPAEIDLRSKIDARTDAALDALAQATGKTKSEIAREWLQVAAEQMIEEASITARALANKGLLGEPQRPSSPAPQQLGEGRGVGAGVEAQFLAKNRSKIV